MTQQTDFHDDLQRLWWDEAETWPKMQAVVSGYVLEGLTGPHDDGFRSLFCRGGIQKAVALACRRAHVVAPDFGMVLDIEYTGTGARYDPSEKRPKEYCATITVVADPANDARFFSPLGATNGRTARRAASSLAPGHSAY